MKTFSLLLLPVLLVFTHCSSQPKMQQGVNTDSRPIAFPGAEGFGKYTTGGRGGKVYVVTNLDDKGTGSFREAAEAKENRIIVFALSGTIHLETKLSIKGNVTIAGHSAPGDGICIADNSVGFGGDNIIVRYMRFRMGDKYQKGGMVDGNGGDDAFGGTRRKNIIIDHCSMSWSTDEVFSFYAGDSTTIQWNIITEPLNYSYHFETGDKDYEHHGFGGIWGGAHTSAHHNLFAHCNNRNPRFDGIRNAKTELVDYCNNVIYNWGGNNIYAGEGGDYNLVNNYFKYGPETNERTKYRIVNPGNKLPQISFGKFYVAGNYVDGSPEVTANNYLGVHMGNDGTEQDKKQAVIDKPHASVTTKMESAKKAFESVMSWVGASYRRDTMDARIINDVKNRTGRFIDVQGGYPHGTDYALTLNAWPALKSIPASADTDKDGMPDEWEIVNGLNPKDQSDASQYKAAGLYTNIEVYINTILK
ncbi:MAG: pectate lyase family protein [Ferruginibacter sp.]